MLLVHRPPLLSGILLETKSLVFLSLMLGAASLCGASPLTYDAAAAFEQGWTTQTNPNGVWSYGYSSGFANPVTLYNQTTTFDPDFDPSAQLWLSSSVNIGDSPSVLFNNGPAFANGNVDYLANELVLVAGIGGQYSDLVFTAPADGTYVIDFSARGDQSDVGTVVGVVGNGSVLFNSSITALGQTESFDTNLTLSAGNTVVFSVGPGAAEQNTGISATIMMAPPSETTPEPSTLALMVAAIALLGFKRTSQ